LKAARAELMSSATPEIAELEKARTAAREAEDEAKRNARRLESLNREFDYMRSSYQEASAAAAEASSELAELKAQAEILTRKASGETLKLRQHVESLYTKELETRVRELKAQLDERDKSNHRKDEEIKALLVRGRGMVTRGSTPKSPRPRSRAASPLPGSSPMLGHAPMVHLSPLGQTSHVLRFS